MDEHRDNTHVRLPQPRLDLDPDEVLRVVKSAPALGVLGGCPAGADDRDQEPAGGDRLVDLLDEVDPRLHVEVHEHLLLTEA